MGCQIPSLFARESFCLFMKDSITEVSFLLFSFFLKKRKQKFNFNWLVKRRAHVKSHGEKKRGKNEAAGGELCKIKFNAHVMYGSASVYMFSQLANLFRISHFQSHITWVLFLSTLFHCFLLHSLPKFYIAQMIYNIMESLLSPSFLDLCGNFMPLSNLLVKNENKILIG